MSKNKIIIYEKLNLFTLCLALVGRHIFKEQYFIDFSPFVKKYFFNAISHLNCKQIHELDFLGKGFTSQVSKTIIDITEKIAEENRHIVSTLVNYGRDKKYIYVLKHLLNESLFNDISRYYLLKLFSAENECRLATPICFFPTKIRIHNILNRPEYQLPKIAMITFYYPMLKIIDLFSRLFYIFCFIAYPFFMFIRLMKNGQVTLKTKAVKRIKKKILFEHRRLELFSGNITSDMYLFRNNIIAISDCIHATSFGKFSEEKSSYLKKKGGVVMDYRTYKVSLHYIFKRLLIDYPKFIVKNIFTLSFSRYTDFIFVRRYLNAVGQILKFENFIKQIDVKLIYFENEQLNAYKICSIISNKHNIKTMSMPHGFSAITFPSFNRANALFNYYLVPGRSRPYLESSCPGVEKFCAVGNHEIDDNQYNLIDSISLQKVKEKKKKYTTIGVVASYHYPFFPDRQFYPLFYDKIFYDKTWNMFQRYWMPFFEWAGKKENIFFIFQGKKILKQYEHPYLKKALGLIPHERYIQDDNLRFQDVITLSDLVVSSRSETAIFSSLCMGVPTASIDFMYHGFNFKKYSKYVVGETAEEFIDNIEYMLENGLPKEVFDNFRKDYYGIDGEVDGKTRFRIKGIIENILNRQSI